MLGHFVIFPGGPLSVEDLKEHFDALDCGYEWVDWSEVLGKEPLLEWEPEKGSEVMIFKHPEQKRAYHTFCDSLESTPAERLTEMMEKLKKRASADDYDPLYIAAIGYELRKRSLEKLKKALEVIMEEVYYTVYQDTGLSYSDESLQEEVSKIMKAIKGSAEQAISSGDGK